MYNTDKTKRKILLINRKIAKIKKTKNKSVSLVLKRARLMQGKRLRGLITLMAAELKLKSAGSTALNAAAAMEILHSATLIHDDIIDNSKTRRGGPALASSLGYDFSVIAGDYLFSYVTSMVLSEKNWKLMGIFAAAVRDICEGELEEIYNRGNYSLSEKQYFSIINRKTASLMKASALCGAAAGGITGRNCSLLSAFGQDFGMAFQIRDDILDIISTGRVLGKPAGSDIKEGKATLPFIYALKSAGPREKQAMVSAFKKGDVKKTIYFIALLLQTNFQPCLSQKHILSHFFEPYKVLNHSFYND